MAAAKDKPELPVLKDEPRLPVLKHAIEVDGGLVPMIKDGDVSHVHPSTVKSHIDAGWKVKG